MTEPSDESDAIAGRLAAHLGGAQPPALIGQGYCNRVYRLDEATVLKLAKPHRLAFASAEHAKEHWCATRVRALDVATPAVTSNGMFEGRPYCLQEFVDGAPPVDRIAAWQQMGRWARAIHAVPVVGWGPRYTRDNVFADDWQKQLAYNIAALSDDDPLIAMGAIDRSRSDDLRRRFERLVTIPFTMGLCHGDLGVHNLLQDASGALMLIDWGCAAAAPVPHYDIAEAIRYGHASAEDLAVFRDAYGLPAETWSAFERDLPDLLAFREVDTLRWAIERAPGQIDAQKERLARALARLD